MSTNAIALKPKKSSIAPSNLQTLTYAVYGQRYQTGIKTYCGLLRRTYVL